MLQVWQVVKEVQLRHYGTLQIWQVLEVEFAK